MTRTVLIVAGVSLAVWSAPLDAQACGLTLRVTAAWPLEDLPPEASPSRRLGFGPGGGVGVSCRSRAGLGYGGTLLVQDFDWITAAYALGEIGTRLALGAEPTAPWLRPVATAGLVYAGELGSRTLELISGENTKLPGGGFAFGGGARLGFPASGGAFFLEGLALGTFLDAKHVSIGGEPDRELGFRGFLAPLVTIGYQFTP
ncbi:MAG: hypothetical protein R3266_09130 [Gemmatimonadota bacterium]|nr:hypothetical protein [Gemmatimonadota bacterium]